MQETSLTPIIIAGSTRLLIPTISEYLEQIVGIENARKLQLPLPTDLVSHATSSAPIQPLSNQDADVLIDTFPSLGSLEQGTRGVDGTRTLVDCLGSSTAFYLAEFWEDEWLI